MTSINLGILYSEYMGSMEPIDISQISQSLMNNIENILSTIYNGDVYDATGQYVGNIIKEYIETFIYAIDIDNKDTNTEYKKYFIFLIMTIIQKLVDLISIISTDYNMECISTRNRFTRRQGEYINEAVYKLRNDSPNIKIISNILYNIINDQKNVQTLDYCCKLLLSSYNLIEQKIYDLLIKLKTAKLQGDAIKYQQMSTNSGVTLDTVMSKINQSGLFTEHPNNIDDALDKLIIHIKDLQSQNNNMLTLSNAQKAMEGVNPVDWSTENFQENTEKISKLSRLASERRPSGFINGPRIDLDDLGGMMSGHALNPHQSIFGTQLGTEFNPRNQGKRHPYSKDTPSIWSDSPQAWPSHPGQRQSSSAGSGT